ncbi:hypothetical protein CL653_03815, partial [bacterium]|nr:hypothetical protein [bacterium]
MKTLKFKTHLCDKILDGSKTSTWRLFDDKDLQVGDELKFINKDTGETFGTATIISLYTKTLGTLEDKDWEGHEQFASDEEMYETYRSYYGDEVDEDSEAKILSFSFYPLLSEFRGESISFVETSQVKEGIVCDVYSFNTGDSKDLGVVRVSKGYKTPLQRVLKGDKTLEIFQTGQGVLNVTDTDGVEIQHSFPPVTSAEVEIKVGDLVRWEATEDLIFAEICYPPYQDGR